MQREQENHFDIERDRTEAPGGAKSSDIWIGLFAGLVTWIIHFAVTYAVASTACQIGFLVDSTLLGINALTATLLIISIVALAILIYALFLTIRSWRKLRGDDRQHLVGTPEGDRFRFMAFAATGLNLFFAVSVILNAVSSLFFNPCQ